MKSHSPAWRVLLFVSFAFPLILPAQTAVPFIDGLRPTSIAPGSPNFSMTIDGANFAPGAVVQFDGATLTPVSVHRNRIVFPVPAPLVTSAHTATVKVLNPTPPAIAASNAAFFPITKPAGLAWLEKAFPYASTGITGAGGIAVGDFNGDGHLDLALSGSNLSGVSGYITILLGDGHGGFKLSASSPFASGFPRTGNIEVGDFNGDGKLDLAVEILGPNIGDDGVAIFLGNGTGSFTAVSFVALSGVQFCENNGFHRFGVGDINGDGFLDLVFPNNVGNTIIILLGNGLGSFTPSSAVAPGSFGPHPCSVTLGDFNGDGWLDVAMGEGATPPLFDLVFAFNDRTGGFSPANTFTGHFDGGPADGLAAGDLNADGLLDLVGVSTNNAPPLTVFTNQGSKKFLNTLETGMSSIDQYSEVALGDLRGTGALDAVVSGGIVGGISTASLGIFTGDGKGHLSANSIINSSGGAIALRLGDFNEDGRLDIATAGVFAGDTFVLWLQGVN